MTSSSSAFEASQVNTFFCVYVLVPRVRYEDAKFYIFAIFIFARSISREKREILYLAKISRYTVLVVAPSLQPLPL